MASSILVSLEVDLLIANNDYNMQPVRAEIEREGDS